MDRKLIAREYDVDGICSLEVFKSKSTDNVIFYFESEDECILESSLAKNDAIRLAEAIINSCE